MALQVVTVLTKRCEDLLDLLDLHRRCLGRLGRGAGAVRVLDACRGELGMARAAGLAVRVVPGRLYIDIDIDIHI